MEEKKYEVVLINDDQEENIPKMAQAIIGCRTDSCWLDYGSCSGEDTCIVDF